MAKQYAHIPERWARFITEQKIFFVATATCDSRVNVSPKGLDSLRILDPNRVAWLNLTGSGNESAAHVQSDPRMTLMFCAFGGEPVILRLYGTARAVHQADPAWPVLAALFPPLPGARQIFDVAIALWDRARRPPGRSRLAGACRALSAVARRPPDLRCRDRPRAASGCRISASPATGRTCASGPRRRARRVCGAIGASATPSASMA
nr:pyridoxamine 5'-phosphate oxidase family protein [Acidiferrobacter sp. SPIII_3]